MKYLAVVVGLCVVAFLAGVLTGAIGVAVVAAIEMKREKVRMRGVERRGTRRAKPRHGCGARRLQRM